MCNGQPGIRSISGASPLVTNQGSQVGLRRLHLQILFVYNLDLYGDPRRKDGYREGDTVSPKCPYCTSLCRFGAAKTRSVVAGMRRNRGSTFTANFSSGNKGGTREEN